MKFFYLYIILFICCVCLSCSSTKYVPEGDSLYTGSDFKIQSGESRRFIKVLRSDLEEQLKPKPNTYILGLPLKLNFYSLIGKPKKQKGLKYNLSTKFGQAPVLFSSVSTSFTQKALEATLFNNGMFDAAVNYKIHTSKNGKKTHVTYEIKTGTLYKIDDYSIQIKDTAILHLLTADTYKSSIKKGRRYDLDRIRREREKINDLLKNNGYYHFNEEYLVFEADTSGSKASVTMRLKLKSQTTKESITRYKIGGVYVALDSNYVAKHFMHKTDTAEIDRVTLYLNEDFKPSPIAEYVYLKGGEYYSMDKQQLTLSRLMGMNLFKYVDIDIVEKDSSKLDVYIHILPLPKRSVSVEIEVVSKSNNFIGPGVNLNYTDRNAFKGGEKLSFGFHGSIETQLNGQFKGLYTYELGPRLNLTIPRFILPFKVKASSYFTPNTLLTSNYTFLKRVNYFEMRTLQFSFGYKWKESLAIEHYLRPVNISFFNISHISNDFNAILEDNPALNRRYEDQLIAGIMYSYTYNQQVYPKRKNQIYFNGNIDIAGNTLSAINKLIGSPENTIGTKTVADIAYAQYAKFDIDLRNYLKTSRKTVFASHMILGWGIPYGNSSALPFVKGFFSGGTNSLRAFPVNSVGPGTYRLPDSLQSSYFIQQGGDIKIEWSAEYRFPIISIFKGAFFVDAGNVWLYKNNDLIPGAQFKLKKAFTELAIGAGFGLRVDLNFFVIRFDLATPVRKPWLTEGERWVLDDVKLGTKDWRKQNLILNIAIGYPF
ncbi:BamA/TamA family outer membrane protein [Cytophaga aurantiaca]|uniref:translocation and assembly module lipoprotein TamL n=1 Tax=Cytophaga aurantiaca TaxID=29530 RepID=UPI0003645704|nr:BamA/TamA family outer membrane protein [Cytophaga aurantiaca]